MISWTDTEIEGQRAAPVAALESGATWRWAGRSVRIDGTGPEADRDAFQARAAAAARRLLGRALPDHRARTGPDLTIPGVGPTFAVSDGVRRWTATLIEVSELARPLVVFEGAVPPARAALSVAEGISRPGALNRITDVPTGVICFTRGTMLSTPEGDRPVEALAEGDRIETRDAGPQDIVWMGGRRMSGARLYAMPELRPVRIRSGALGDGRPECDLLVSPRHRMLISGPVAQALFGTDEVLVAAEDLLNDRTVGRDHELKDVDYIHLLLPRHHVVRANGIWTESFHPASTDLAAIDPVQRSRLAEIVPGIEENPAGYGAAARRELNRSEAAILRFETGQRRRIA